MQEFKVSYSYTTVEHDYVIVEAEDGYDAEERALETIYEDNAEVYSVVEW